MSLIQSHYYFNVTKSDHHYFATGDTITDEAHALEVFADLQKRFPEKEGFKVTASYATCHGSFLTEAFLDLLKQNKHKKKSKA